MKALLKLLAVLAFLSFLAPTAHAGPLSVTDVPEPLKPWVDWVLYEQDEQTCPHAYNSNQRFCAWPSALRLELDRDEGRFSQQWFISNEAWVRLPGNGNQWPHGVEVDGINAVVVNRQGFPSVKLSRGEHEVNGVFQWDSIPESLTIPPATGLIEIQRDGETIEFPRINEQGQLWLDKSLQEQDVQDALDVQVYRKITDEHPLQVETRVILNVSGRSRDVQFPGLQLPGFTAYNLISQLPARVNQHGDLQVQVRPGNWQIQLLSYHPELLEQLALNITADNLPTQEVWVFDARPALRLTEISGVPAVDSRQTRLPQEWHRYPAYLLERDQVMTFKTLQRGSLTPEPDRLSLRRDMWMDFDGGGFTINDAINGTMSSGWRLSVDPQLELGSVRVDGEPQFITTLRDGDSKGIEVRRGQINLEAASRYTESTAAMAVTGWQHDFRTVSTNLYLPPGWKLFSVHGVDNLPNTWLQRWTLLDLFMVLIIAIAIGRLWNWKWGLFALLTMALIWHEANAPKLIWLHLIAAVALLRVLPEGIFKKLTWWYRNATLLALVLVLIPFAILQVRGAIYPQIGLHANYDRPVTTSAASPVNDGMLEYSVIAEEAMPDLLERGRTVGKMITGSDAPGSVGYGDSRRNQASQTVDPNANIQTGPGLPAWNWQLVRLQWNSPVSQGQELHLNLIPPTLNMLLNFLRVLFLVLLIARLLRAVSRDDKPDQPKKPGQHFARATSPLLLLPVLFGLTGPCSESYAETVNNATTVKPVATAVGKNVSAFPDEQMLQRLRERLLADAECLPACAQIETLQMELSEAQLTLHLKVHAAADVAIPLPGQSGQWRPDYVLLQNRIVDELSRDQQGNLWLGLKAGIHAVTLQGRLPNQAQLQLSLPLLPKSVQWRGDGWVVEGIRDNNVPSSQLQLIRNRALADETAIDEGENNILPPLLEVERTLHLGLDWTVVTRLRRLSPVGSPISIRVPLLPQESVLSNAFSINNGELLVTMSAAERELNWTSQLPVAGELSLEAIRTEGLVESWKLDISPIWHVDIDGIPAVHNTSQNSVWLPEWQPWPGEKINLQVSRPEGVEGRTLTIDRSIMTVSLGKRSRESSLRLQLRSSRGGQHAIRLPENAELLSVSINGNSQPVRQQQGEMSLPIVPGEQAIEIKWREANAIGTMSKASPVDLGLDSVNNSTTLQLGRDRWVLFTNGPLMGPAVLFWGVLLVILLGSVILGRIKDSPLKSWQWFLLGVGLSLATPLMIVIVVGWLLAMQYRPRLQSVQSAGVFNLAQTLLILLTLGALGVLTTALQQGLLGWPEMQIAGNGSHAWELRWYQDRVDKVLPQPWVISLPLMAYRVLMLLWALWLAFSLIGWLRQGWQNFTVGGLWRESEKSKKKKAAADKTLPADSR
ncbi:MAG: hypothetical protein KDJ38_02525 [Gammaproteobacteria bacterium]|nr:hypothetical protein [Gammaproteobacteria bacterium]